MKYMLKSVFVDSKDEVEIPATAKIVKMTIHGNTLVSKEVYYLVEKR